MGLSRRLIQFPKISWNHLNTIRRKKRKVVLIGQRDLYQVVFPQRKRMKRRQGTLEVGPEIEDILIKKEIESHDQNPQEEEGHLLEALGTARQLITPHKGEDHLKSRPHVVTEKIHRIDKDDSGPLQILPQEELSDVVHHLQDDDPHLQDDDLRPQEDVLHLQEDDLRLRDDDPLRQSGAIPRLEEGGIPVRHRDAHQEDLRHRREADYAVKTGLNHPLHQEDR